MPTDWLDKYKVEDIIPEGTSGAWSVERFTIEADVTTTIFNCHAGHRWVQPGTYTRLVRAERHARVVVMADTRAEILENLEMARHAHGHILINGLGLGVVLRACLRKPGVEHATVIELSPDVIALVGRHYEAFFGDRLTIIQADALEWEPPKGLRYGACWHDIWDFITPANLPAMHRLHRKYGRRCDWQGSWARHDCERAE